MFWSKAWGSCLYGPSWLDKKCEWDLMAAGVMGASGWAGPHCLHERRVFEGSDGGGGRMGAR